MIQVDTSKYFLRKFYDLTDFAKENLQHGYDIGVKTERNPKSLKSDTLKHGRNEVKKTITRLLFSKLLSGSIIFTRSKKDLIETHYLGGFCASDLIKRNSEIYDYKFNNPPTERKIKAHLRSLKKDGIIKETACRIRGKEILYNFSQDHPLRDFTLECVITIQELKKMVEALWKLRDPRL